MSVSARNTGLSGWTLDPTVDFLNHGSFGACPKEVLTTQQELRSAMEAEPVRFMVRELPPLLDAARAQVAAFVDADADDLAFVNNATTAVNGVLRSLRFAPGDELLTTDHAYNACKNALDWVARRAGAKIVVARVPFPIDHADQVVAAITAAATDRTRIALIDHVTSQTGLVWPVAQIVAELAQRSIDVLVDGAHAPGMVPLSLRKLGAAYYTGNCHKWMCAPKGAAFLVVRKDRQPDLMPTVISHGANADLHAANRSRFRLLHDWVGTNDPSAWLCVPAAIQWMAKQLPGGWPAILERNHALALEARRILGRGTPCPDDMIGSMAAVPLPDGDWESLGRELYETHHIEVPIFPWPAPPRRMLRISAQLYNTPDQYERLRVALALLSSA